MREYCGINLGNGDFYVGSTADIERRLKAHEDKERVGKGVVYWLVGDEHEDDYRTEEQYYLDFYFRSPGCLNLSGNSLLGNGNGRIVSEETRERMSQAALGNTKGKANKGQKRTHKRRYFGRVSNTPTATRQKQREAKIRVRGPRQSLNAQKAARLGHLSRWGGFNDVYPATREFRTALSSDFVDYFAAYGWW